MFGSCGIVDSSYLSTLRSAETHILSNPISTSLSGVSIWGKRSIRNIQENNCNCKRTFLRPSTVENRDCEKRVTSTPSGVGCRRPISALPNLFPQGRSLSESINPQRDPDRGASSSRLAGVWTGVDQYVRYVSDPEHRRLSRYLGR
jgi:hypothetical protein